jgi:galactokinase
MTGGGFGGSTVNLVRRDACRTFEEKIAAAYERATGIAATILNSEPSEGASEITTL